MGGETFCLDFHACEGCVRYDIIGIASRRTQWCAQMSKACHRRTPINGNARDGRDEEYYVVIRLSS